MGFSIISLSGSSTSDESSQAQIEGQLERADEIQNRSEKQLERADEIQNHLEKQQEKYEKLFKLEKSNAERMKVIIDTLEIQIEPSD